MKILRATRIERCIGCQSCSLACARLVHQRISWSTAGIRIVSSGGISTGFEAKLCLACDPAPCVAACPTGSYSQRKSGGVKVDKSLCIRCGECAKACPVDAIFMEPETNLPYVCIHCGRCVPFCPHSCLELVSSPHEKPGDAAEKSGPGESVSTSDAVSLQASGASPQAQPNQPPQEAAHAD